MAARGRESFLARRCLARVRDRPVSDVLSANGLQGIAVAGGPAGSAHRGLRQAQRTGSARTRALGDPSSRVLGLPPTSGLHVPWTLFVLPASSSLLLDRRFAGATRGCCPSLHGQEDGLEPWRGSKALVCRLSSETGPQRENARTLRADYAPSRRIGGGGGESGSICGARGVGSIRASGARVSLIGPVARAQSWRQPRTALRSNRRAGLGRRGWNPYVALRRLYPTPARQFGFTDHSAPGPRVRFAGSRFDFNAGLVSMTPSGRAVAGVSCGEGAEPGALARRRLRWPASNRLRRCVVGRAIAPVSTPIVPPRARSQSKPRAASRWGHRLLSVPHESAGASPGPAGIHRWS
jgi:hypothetical protein